MTVWENRIQAEVASFKERWAEADKQGWEGQRVLHAILPLVGSLYDAELELERLNKLVVAYQSLIEAGRPLAYTGGSLPPEFSPQWRARAESAEAALARIEHEAGKPDA